MLLIGVAKVGLAATWREVLRKVAGTVLANLVLVAVSKLRLITDINEMNVLKRECCGYVQEGVVNMIDWRFVRRSWWTGIGVRIVLGGN